MNDEIEILDKKLQIFTERYKEYRERNYINNIEFKECLCDVLSWIEICIKKIDNLNEMEKGIISAIKYANNMKKHSITICKYTYNTYTLYPSEGLYPSEDLYPSDFTIYWNELPLDNERFINQYNNYNKWLKNKEVCNSINDIYNIIKKYSI